MRHRLVLEYDGTNFHGWQVQPGGVRTVAGELIKALAQVTGESPRLVAAGRTDSGAHSLGQTVNFELSGEVSPPRLLHALNAVLPEDVAVVASDEAPEGFHARFSARRRTYRYLVENREPRAALLRNHAWHVPQPLDVGAMRAAAEQLQGRRDLALFGTDPAGRNNTVRNLEMVRIRRVGEVLAIDVRADAFLYGMVRRIVGFLVDVGSGRTPKPRPAVAPARGLYQLSVEY